MAAVVLPVVALPVWALAVAYLVAGVVSSTHWLGYRSAIAAALFRTCLAGAVYWSVVALIVGSTTRGEAAGWMRLFLPAAYLAMAGLVDAAIALNGMRVTTWRATFWGVGLAALGFFALDPGTVSWFAVHRVPDGFFLAAVAHHPLFEAARAIVFCAGVAALLALVIRGLRAHSGRPWGFYLAAVLVSVPLVVNDALWVQRHRTPFPSTWLVGVMALAVLWRELWAEGHSTYQALNRDRTTDAASRAFGEIAGERSLRLGPVGVVYVDLDNFKSVNDRFGHAAGDGFLREIVRRLVGSCRPGDTVVRMGGDELLVLLPGCGHDDGTVVVDRLRAAVSGAPIAIEGPSGAAPAMIRPAVSLGFAWGAQGSSFGHLVQRADAAMYSEKREHRQSGTAAGLGDEPGISG